MKTPSRKRVRLGGVAKVLTKALRLADAVPRETVPLNEFCSHGIDRAREKCERCEAVARRNRVDGNDDAPVKKQFGGHRICTPKRSEREERAMAAALLREIRVQPPVDGWHVVSTEECGIVAMFASVEEANRHRFDLLARCLRRSS